MLQKFQLLRYTVKDEPITFPYLTSEDTVIEAKSEVTDLGILMSSSGSFKLHVGEIIKKAREKVELEFQGVFNTGSKTNAYSIPSFNSAGVEVPFPVMAPRSTWYK